MQKKKKKKRAHLSCFLMVFIKYFYLFPFCNYHLVSNRFKFNSFKINTGEAAPIKQTASRTSLSFKVLIAFYIKELLNKDIIKKSLLNGQAR